MVSVSVCHLHLFLSILLPWQLPPVKGSFARAGTMIEQDHLEGHP